MYACICNYFVDFRNMTPVTETPEIRNKSNPVQSNLISLSRGQEQTSKKISRNKRSGVHLSRVPPIYLPAFTDSWSERFHQARNIFRSRKSAGPCRSQIVSCVSPPRRCKKLRKNWWWCDNQIAMRNVWKKAPKGTKEGTRVYSYSRGWFPEEKRCIERAWLQTQYYTRSSYDILKVLYS